MTAGGPDDESGDGWVRLAPTGRLPAGQAVRVEATDLSIALFNTPDGLCAIGGVCPHAGGPLEQGQVDRGVVRCPWHGWRYDLRTGQRIDRKGQPVNVYAARVDDGWIWLRLRP